MYLLKRTISPYTGPDLLLGVFISEDTAQAARQKYLSKYLGNPRSDPWREQAYHEVNLEDDVQLIDTVPTSSPIEDSCKAYVVSAYSEAFGQILREFKFICPTLESAQECVTRLEDEDDGKFPFYCEIDSVIVGDLLSDLREEY